MNEDLTECRRGTSPVNNYDFCSKQFVKIFNNNRVFEKTFDVKVSRKCRGYCGKLNSDINSTGSRFYCINFNNAEYLVNHKFDKKFLGVFQAYYRFGNDLGSCIVGMEFKSHVLFKQHIKRVNYNAYHLYGVGNIRIGQFGDRDCDIKEQIIVKKYLKSNGSRHVHVLVKFALMIRHMIGISLPHRNRIPYVNERDVKKYISTDIKTENLIKIIRLILSIFTTKNMTKLICYHV